MLATSEELAAQAEQLQASIAYFRTDEQRGAAGAAVRAHAVARPAHAPEAVKPARPTRAKPVPVRIAAAKPIGSIRVRGPAKANGAAKGNGVDGFALDLTSGGPDARDAEFERV